jgi:hypothetical protein
LQDAHSTTQGRHGDPSRPGTKKSTSWKARRVAAARSRTLATSPDLSTSSSVVIFGSQDEYWQRILGDRHTYVACEFGTYNPERARGAAQRPLAVQVSAG